MSPRVHRREGVNLDGEGGRKSRGQAETARHPLRRVVKRLSEIAFYITGTDATFPKVVVNKNKN